MKYIKLFEKHGYSVYELITMGVNQALGLLIQEILKKDPDLDLIRDIFEYSVVDINDKDSEDLTALMNAAQWGTAKSVELLLNHPGIDVNLQNKWGTTALIYGVGSMGLMGKEKSFELLLSHPGIDVNLQDEWGLTALMHATFRKSTKCVELLLKHPKINVNLQDENGQTAWDMANDFFRQKFPQLNPDFR